MKIYLTKYDAIYGLHKSGYTHDFQIAGNDLLWVQEKIFLDAGNFVIDQYHKFSDDEIEGRGIIVFGVVAAFDAVKGILIRHYKRGGLKVPPAKCRKIQKSLSYSAEKGFGTNYSTN